MRLLEVDTEKHLLLSLEAAPDINIYGEESTSGRRNLDNCPSKDGCVKYLLDRRGLDLGTKISEENAKVILANYSCITCENCKPITSFKK
jgi:hypothetical protein